jgi:phenylalanyl-tRNA synthetase alpha chain
MSPKKKSAYSVPKLKDFSAASLDKAAEKLLAALENEAEEVVTLFADTAISTPIKNASFKDFRDRWMARKNGILTEINEGWLKSASPAAKRDVGRKVNELKVRVEARMSEVQERFVTFGRMSAAALVSLDKLASPQSLSSQSAQLSVDAETLDISLPGNRRPLGAEHPVIKTMNEIVGVFRNLGYSVEEGPEIETDYYNFEALNFPPNHPARDTQDTLFIANQESKPLRERLLLRTHTSPVQIRTMEKMKPPVRVVCPGKVHRNDAPDATHSPIFHQVEGLAVDRNITFCDLKGTLDHAMKALFGSSVKTRFYPSFFPFTEPSADVQISCIFCGGRGYRDGGPCRNCKASGWIELLGCGMVDPNVYGFVDYDAKRISGFAFGMGVERIAILKYGVDDIQLFFNGDVRFLEQFA